MLLLRPQCAVVRCDAGLWPCAHWQEPDWLLLVLAGRCRQLRPACWLVRARWTAIYSGTPQLQTAFALEGVLDDLAFIGRPTAVGGPEHAAVLGAGPLAAALFLIIGVGLFVVQRRTEPPVSPIPARKQAGLQPMLRQPGGARLALFMLAHRRHRGRDRCGRVPSPRLPRASPAWQRVVLSCWRSCAMDFAVWRTLRLLQMPLSRQIVWSGHHRHLRPALLLASNPDGTDAGCSAGRHYLWPDDYRGS